MPDFNDFKTRLKIAKNKNNNSETKNRAENVPFIGNAFKLGTELVSAVLVGTIIGFILDSWFDTKPWLILLFFFLGSVAGIMNIIKVATKMQKKD
tara:strand:- start:58 stop:342 length:285 start_codon:yes stop_codon:yes gene_type:complete